MRTSKLKLRDFAHENDWLEIYDSPEEVGYLLPDGRTVVAHFDQSGSLQRVIDSNDSDVDVSKEA